MQNGQKIFSIEGKHLVGEGVGPRGPFEYKPKTKKEKKKAAGGWSALGEWVNFFFVFLGVISLYNFVFFQILVYKL